jgi:shikimate dehydrogenase
VPRHEDAAPNALREADLMRRIRLGLIGDAIGPSRAPDLHRLAGHLAGLDVVYERLVPAERGLSFEALLDECRRSGFRGLNVTYPYKERAFLRSAPASADVARIGAVNTLLLDGDDAIAGHNTDWSGFRRAFREAFGDRRAGRVAIAGAGGVARAIGFALLDLGAGAIVLHDMDGGRAARLAEELRAAAPGLDARAAATIEAALDGADGIVNATPVGMAGHPGSAVPVDRLGAGRWAFDAVYTPAETEFLVAARDAGLDLLPGTALFVAQGVDAFRLFTGCEPDAAALRRALALPVA